MSGRSRREVAPWQKSGWPGELRREQEKDKGEHGAIVFVQRFGGSVNLNLHLRVLVLDGLFVQKVGNRDGSAETASGLLFHDTGCPTPEMIERVVLRVRDDGRESLRLAQGVVLTAQSISVQHLDGLLGGELLAATPRLPWSQLLRRTYGFDVLRCGCGGRLRLVTAITDKAVARAILTHLGLPADARWARGRRPARLRRPRSARPLAERDLGERCQLRVQRRFHEGDGSTSSAGGTALGAGPAIAH